jgi:uncharacterized protein YbjT (DUF2867 family)
MQSEAKSPKSVLILGGTGLVGTHLVSLSAKHPNVRVTNVAVRQTHALLTLPQLPNVKWCPIDFNRLESDPSLFEVDAVLCALGTTIKKAGSKEAFKAVDFEIPLSVARIAKRFNASRFGLVSSMQANPRSIFFYTRTKGKLEETLITLGYSSLVLARPSLLLGDRSEHRLGEDVAKALLAPIHSMIPRAFRPIEAFEVARKLLDFTLSAPPGVHILSNAELHR